MSANFVLIALALVTGWLALFPIRKVLGAWGYHVSAWLVGLLAWTVVTSLTTLVGSGYSWGAVVAGHLLFVIVLGLAGTLLLRTDVVEASGDVAWWTWLVGGAGVLGAGAACVFRGVTMVAFDSYTHYDLSGLWLLDTGQIDTTVIGGRNVLVPSLHAAVRFFGGEWTYAVYPMLSLTALILLFTVLKTQAFCTIRLRYQIGLSALLVAVLAATPGWVFHSFFVHSNMISATYLILAVTGIGFASRFGELSDKPEAWAWTLLAGLGIAGLTLSRPDGLAYLFVPLALAALLYLGGYLGTKSYVILAASMFAPILVVYGATIAELGVWNAYKLDGIVVVALIGAAAAFWRFFCCVRSCAPFRDWLELRGNSIRLAVAVNVVTVLPLVYWKREDFVPALSNMIGNLLQHGEWGFLWYALAGVVVISLVFSGIMRRSHWSWYLLYALAQFFCVAAVVHGIAHPGRLSWMDSFNRVSLHVLPIAFWYVGSFMGALFDSYRDGDEGSSA